MLSKEFMSTFPWSNAHELNLNWILQQMQDVLAEVKTLDEAVAALKAYVDSYFSNLDVQTEINNKIDKMYKAGELDELFQIYLDPEIVKLNKARTSMVNTVNFNNDIFAAIEFAKENHINYIFMGTDLTVNKTIFLYDGMTLDLGGHTLTTGDRKMSLGKFSCTGITNYNRFYKTSSGSGYLHEEKIDSFIGIRNGKIVDLSWDDEGLPLEDWAPRGTVSSTAGKTLIENVEIDSNINEIAVWTGNSDVIIRDSRLINNRFNVGGAVWSYNYEYLGFPAPKERKLVIDNCTMYAKVDETIYIDKPYTVYVNDSDIQNLVGHSISLYNGGDAYVTNTKLNAVSFPIDSEGKENIQSNVHLKDCIMSGGTKYEYLHVAPHMKKNFPIVSIDNCVCTATTQLPVTAGVKAINTTFKTSGEGILSFRGDYKWFDSCEFLSTANFATVARSLRCTDCYFINEVYMNEGAADNALFTGCQFLGSIEVADAGTKGNVVIASSQSFASVPMKPQATKCVLFTSCTFANTPIGTSGFDNVGCVQWFGGNYIKIADTI